MSTAAPEDATEELVVVLRRWAALVSAGLTEEAAWRETARMLPDDDGHARHAARLRAERLAWDAAGDLSTGRDAPDVRGLRRDEHPPGDTHDASPDRSRRRWCPPWRTPPPDPGWALVDAALAAGARAGAAPAVVVRRLA
ncbi:hypothetical protein NWP10_12045, partial [Micrococcus sp. HG099]|nr:hypothetical protein [Micrococcus sp. HG099]